jgi:transcription termination/antitermination protein NusG
MGNHGQTERGGALSLLATADRAHVKVSDVGAHQPQWYALWTHSHCEQLVRGQLDSRGFEVFLPTIGVWSWRAGVKHRIRRPLFPGYLFVRDVLSASRYVELLKARGLVGVLGGQDGGPGEIPEVEIDAIRSLVNSKLPASPYPYLQTGRRARISEGPLAGVKGILVDRRAGKRLLVLSVHLFRRSVAVEVDCPLAVAA